MVADLSTVDSFPILRDLSRPFDPPAVYQDLRRESPAHPVRIWNGNRVWLFSRYEDCRTVLSDPRFSAVPTRPGYPALSPGHAKAAVEDTFLRMDPPEHTRLRRMFAREFTAKSLGGLRGDIDTLVNSLIDDVTAKGPPTDLLKSFCSLLPAYMICQILDVPKEDVEFFKTRTEIAFTFSSPAELVERATAEMLDFVRGLIETRMKNPGDDMISRVAVEHVATGEISVDLAVQNIRRLLEAGHETTANQMALSILVMIEKFPGQWAMLRDNPDLARNATEELLRYVSIAHRFPRRVAIEDVEMHGQTIRAGDGIYTLPPSANRDEARFENADTVDISRYDPGHLAFGWGPHQCFGQTLARLELQSMLSIMPRRLPGLSLAVPFAEIEFDEGMISYGIRALPVTWTA